jgi:hypothetical protein
MIDWKILAVIFASFILLAGSLVSDIGVDDILVSVSDGITGFVGLETSPLARDVEFRATIALDDYDLNTETTNVSITGDPFQLFLETKPRQTIKTGGTAHMRGFRGEVVFVSGTVAFDGTVLEVENIGYDKPTRFMSTGFVYDSVKFNHLSISELKRETRGAVSTDTLNYSLNGTIEIHGFLGNAEFRQGVLILDGKASRIFASGKDKFSLS